MQWILSWFGGGVLKSILGEITTLYAAHANATTEVEKAKIQERIDALHVQADAERARLADRQNARQSISTLPWWAAAIFVMLALPFAIHAVLIGVGTWWVAPADWSTACKCYVDGQGWLEWTRHIPAFPSPFDTREADVFAFFFSSAAFIGVGGAIAGAIGSKRRGAA